MNQKLKSTTDHLLRELAGVDASLADKLGVGIDGYFDPHRHPERLTRGGRRTQEHNHAVNRTLKQISCARRHWMNHWDDQVRHRAKKLVTRALHGESFEKLIEPARKLEGFVQKAGKRRKGSVHHGKACEFDLGRGYAVRSINTVNDLASVGKRFRNCLADNDHGYHDRLRRNELAFYVVEREGVEEAVYTVDEDRGIEECLGPDNDDPSLARDVLWGICQHLGVHGDSLELFVAQGVLGLFTSGLADPDRPDFEDKGFRLWTAGQGKGRLVIASDTEREVDWRPCAWSSRHESWGDDLFCLFYRSRLGAEKFLEVTSLAFDAIPESARHAGRSRRDVHPGGIFGAPGRRRRRGHPRRRR